MEKVQKFKLKEHSIYKSFKLDLTSTDEIADKSIKKYGKILEVAD